MMPINFAQIAEKLGPNKPNTTTKAIKTPEFVENPQSSKHAAADPKHESVMTMRIGQ